jgi:hypothetical protein
VFAVTFDTDWAPQFVVDHALGLLAESGLPGTVFCTSPYAVPGGVEVALHPNLMADSTQGNGEDDILSGLKSAMPEAVGVRTHRLFWYGGLPPLLTRHGLEYDSSLLMPLLPGLRPYRFKGLVRFPIWWSEGVHFDRGLPLDGFTVPGLDEDGLKVLLFHPINVYLNAREAGYAARVVVEIGGMDAVAPETLAPYRLAGPGMETVFTAALDRLAATGAGVRPLKELVDHAA